MRVGLALILNLLLALGVGAWLRRERRRAGPGLRRWLLPTLALRLGVGLAQGSPDAQFMSCWGRALTAAFWARPAAGWALWQGHELRAGQQVLQLYEWSNTLFTIKILSWLNFASLGADWLNGLYLSLGCFVGCWGLVRTLARLFPAVPAGAGVGAFLLWPSVVWWTAGLTKEALLLGSGAALGALVLGKLYDEASLPPAPHGRPGPPGRPWGARLGGWLLVALLAWLHLRMRYFMAMPLLGSLLALAGVGLAGRRGWLRPGWGRQAGALLAGLAVAGALAVAVGGELVSRPFVVSQLWQNYTHGVATSGARPHLEYAHLRPAVSSMLSHAPLAAIQTLTRPWLGESARPLYLAAGLENLLLLSLFGLALVAVARGRASQLPPALVLALLLYCLVLAALIGLSTPNLGTLHRYRAALLPWLLWLLLCARGDWVRR